MLHIITYYSFINSNIQNRTWLISRNFANAWEKNTDCLNERLQEKRFIRFRNWIYSFDETCNYYINYIIKGYDAFFNNIFPSKFLIHVIMKISTSKMAQILGPIWEKDYNKLSIYRFEFAEEEVYAREKKEREREREIKFIDLEGSSKIKPLNIKVLVEGGTFSKGLNSRGFLMKRR